MAACHISSWQLPTATALPCPAPPHPAITAAGHTCCEHNPWGDEGPAAVLIQVVVRVDGRFGKEGTHEGISPGGHSCRQAEAHSQSA